MRDVKPVESSSPFSETVRSPGLKVMASVGSVGFPVGVLVGARVGFEVGAPTGASVSPVPARRKISGFLC
jgi:hypothetical protein